MKDNNKINWTASTIAIVAVATAVIFAPGWILVFALIGGATWWFWSRGRRHALFTDVSRHCRRLGVRSPRPRGGGGPR